MREHSLFFVPFLSNYFQIGKIHYQRPPIDLLLRMVITTSIRIGNIVHSIIREWLNWVEIIRLFSQFFPYCFREFAFSVEYAKISISENHPVYRFLSICLLPFSIIKIIIKTFDEFISSIVLRYTISF